MQPKVKMSMKQELMEKTLSIDLAKGQLEEYNDMLSQSSNLFITYYEEIRGFKGEDLRWELKDGVKPIKQKLCYMGREQV